VENKESNNRKKKGLIITISVHAIALLLFCLFGFEVIDPKPSGFEAEWEIEGIENAGGENNKEVTSENPNQTNDITKLTDAAQASASQEEQLITEDAGIIAVKSSPTKTPVITKPKNVTVNNKTSPSKTDSPKETKPTVDPAILAALGGMKKGTNSDGGKGDGEENGIEGDPSGGGKDLKGTGNKGDGKWSVEGRSPVHIGAHTNSCGVSGKIIVLVKINRSGKVVSASDVGGTTQNECLVNLAISQAKSIKYAPSSSTEPYNEGKIVMDYGLK